MLKCILKTENNSYISTLIRVTNRQLKQSIKITFASSAFEDINDDDYEIVCSMSLYDEKGNMIAFRKMPEEWEPIEVNKEKELVISWNFYLDQGEANAFCME